MVFIWKRASPQVIYNLSGKNEVFSCDIKAGKLEYNYKAPTTGEENNLWLIFPDYKQFPSKIMQGRLVSEIADPFTLANKVSEREFSGVNYNHGQVRWDSNVYFITQFQTFRPFPPFNVVIHEISSVSHLPKSWVKFHIIPEMTSHRLSVVQFETKISRYF